MKRFAVGVMMALCCQLSTYAQERVMPVEFFGEIGLHRAALSGHVLNSDLNISGSELDFDGALGLEDVNGMLGKAGVVLYNQHELLLDYRRYHLEKDTKLATDINIGGINASVDVPISPSLTFQSLGVFYGFRLIDTDLGFLSIRPGVEWVKYDVSVKVERFGFEWQSETYANDYVVPFVLFAGETRLHPLVSLIGEASGGMLDGQKAYMAQLMLKITPHPNIAGLLGYSRTWFRDEQTQNEFEIALSGVVIGAQFSW